MPQTDKSIRLSMWHAHLVISTYLHSLESYVGIYRLKTSRDWVLKFVIDIRPFLKFKLYNIDAVECSFFLDQNVHTHVANKPSQPQRIATKMGVHFSETLVSYEHKMGLKKFFHLWTFA